MVSRIWTQRFKKAWQANNKNKNLRLYFTAHSCSLLIAHKKYKIDGVWHTWINYPRFHQLATSYNPTDPSTHFDSMDYIAPTPDWAVYGHDMKGFDPSMQRVYRQKKKYEGLSGPEEAIKKAAEKRGMVFAK
jgi:hypothetical protein